MDIEKLLTVGSIINQNSEPHRLLAQLGVDASFVYSLVKDGEMKGMIAGKWFRNLEAYVTSAYDGPLSKRVAFNELVRNGLWSAFYAAEVGIMNGGLSQTAEALVTVGLTESGQYGIPMLLTVAEDSLVVPALPALGFTRISEEEERSKVLFVNKYR